MSVLKSSLLLFSFLLLTQLSLGQDRCGTEIISENNPSNQLFLQQPDKFENWLNQKKAERRVGAKALAKGEVYTIPVVFHIIHLGEEVGTGSNISEERIIEQLKVLNEDFRRMNADTVNTPEMFLPVAADPEIEFVFARQDPNGLPTNGIVRKQGIKSGYGFVLNQLPREELSEISGWPTDEYLNIWVANENAIGNFGAAQFPTSDIAGLEDLYEANPNTDGVFMNHLYLGPNEVFWSENQGTFISTGRTVTHEVGHWLGLRHIFDGCSPGDYCDDTPAQNSSNPDFECPDEGSRVACGEISMFQNYMDYTNDLCMNLFTECQKERMRTVLEFASSRNRILSSPGLVEPISVANDMGIIEILEPTLGWCDPLFTPRVTLRNFGSNTVELFEVELMINDELFDSRIANTNLSQYDTLSMAFSTIGAVHEIETLTFKITQVNGGQDGNEDNNCEWIAPVFPWNSSIPLFEDFESDFETITNYWSFRNNASDLQWSQAPAPGQASDNLAMKLSYFESPLGDQDGYDLLISPVFNLTGIVTVDLRFKYAYSKLPQYETDALMVLISTDCGATFPQENMIFHRWAKDLGTTTAVSQDFVPTNASDWQSVDLNFGEFANEEHVVIAIAGRNGGGNNIYVDDIEISTSNVLQLDAKINAVSGVPVVSCQDNFQPIVEVRNQGIDTLRSFDLVMRMSDSIFSKTVEGLEILPGKSHNASLVVRTDELGEQNLEIEIANPNGGTDDDPSNNFHEETLVIDDYLEPAPIKENFTYSRTYRNWVYHSKEEDSTWSIYETDFDNRAALIHCFAPTQLGSRHWMVSPDLDFSEFSEASVRFDLSYANRASRDDRLEVFGSIDCGTTFNEVLYSKAGAELAVTSTSEAWFPSDESDWLSQTINLSQFAGEDNFRMAFVVTNQNGNNLFIDNIEVFNTAEPPELLLEKSMTVFPNPTSGSFQIAFDFNVREDQLTVRLLSLSGELKSEWQVTNALNQVYSVNGLDVRSGMYLVHVFGQHTNLTEKILIENR